LSIRVGVVGAGYWGKNLLRNFADLGALAAFCDTNDAHRDTMALQFPNARPFSDPHALFAFTDLDAVAIATPAVTHGQLVAAALESGKHVFVEKPLCLDIAEAGRLRDRAAALSRTLMVGHLLLYHGAFIALRHCVETGGVGAVRYIYSNRLSLGKIRREENALWSFAPHDVSMILQLMREEPQSVVATGGHYLTPGVSDTTLSHLTFRGGVQAHIFVSWLHPFKEQRLVVVGSDGMAVFDDTQKGPGKLVLYRHVTEWNGDAPMVGKAPAVPIQYEDVEPLRQECAAFLAAVQDGAIPPSDANEGIRVLRVLAACQRSIDAAARVQMSDM
jgi:UDP-2-acetamido-3-amino-2,3-dideoxy-glucuronate N-acetyltransferase